MDSRSLLAGALVVVIILAVMGIELAPSEPEFSFADSAPVMTPNEEKRVPEKLETAPLSMMDLAGINVGETFSLYIPQEERILAGSVERTKVSKAGNEVLEGTILDGGRSYSFVVTVGRHQTFGSIQTSRDRYQFELTDGEGELIAQSTINKSRDFSKPDFVIPRRRESEHVGEKRNFE